ncbi:serine hydrolase domain-containing protein [Catalinimonas niigatensis]|uniref:serine hydrolase domain-containing protein n=1 Tax=Catalinimonas niigatensis TaxID=1397264 RepID=UPI002665ABF8|nr:serine hydrolase domain-containing protein [Catalinimonas niigatensis]WPP52373.1 serine hydrolase domain-containing protein [Catalinimonas niigatensis]
MVEFFACQPQDKVAFNEDVDGIFAPWDHELSPGCALAVIHKGEVVYTKGYGMADLEHGIPITPESVFYIGSVSKQFVATALVLLEEEGKLSLDDNIREYIPELPDYGHPISIRHLIHHTSGFRDNLTLWELSGRSMIDDIPEDEIFALICRQQGLNFIPGVDFSYSNTCYFLMSMIIERVSGQNLRAYAEERIFSPLGMKHSQFNDDNHRIIKNRAFGYTQLAEDSIGNLIMRFDLVGSGGLYSSVKDLYLWDQNFYHNQLGKRGQTLIEQLQTNGKYSNGEEVNYAFAMINGEYRGLRTIHHTGSMGGYRSMYLRFPNEQFSVIILGNIDNLDPLNRAYEVASIFLKDKLSPEKEVMSTSDEPETSQNQSDYPETELNKFVGSYHSPELNATYHLEIAQNQKNILMQTIKQKPVILHISGSNILSDNTYKLDFNKNYQTFNMNYAGTSGIIFKKVAYSTLNE